MYAQKVEGDAWHGEKLDKGKIDKMSGTVQILQPPVPRANTQPHLQTSNLDNCTSLCKPFKRKGVKVGKKSCDWGNLVYGIVFTMRDSRLVRQRSCNG